VVNGGGNVFMYTQLQHQVGYGSIKRDVLLQSKFELSESPYINARKDLIDGVVITSGVSHSSQFLKPMVLMPQYTIF
jgi:hypothetical protein